MAHSATKLLLLRASAAALALLAASCGDSAAPGNPPGGNPPDVNPGSNMMPAKPGQTDFTTEEAGGSNNNRGAETSAPGGGAAGNGGAPPAAPGANPADNAAAPPAGRLGDVEEADIYKVDKNRLFYLNTYRGFIIYDLTDTKKPARVSRLPVFGYPVEMFVSGNTVYALLRDALYLTQVGDQPQFERHNVSQLVTIDISDIAHPRVVKTLDIEGQLREGVSRKIENTIYVVSYFPRSYYWGWRADPSQQQKEKAIVHSFNVADPANPRQVKALTIFEGGSVTIQENNFYYDRSFSSVAISATANALMVVENWNVHAYQNAPTPGVGRAGGGCGRYRSNQFARVSLVDISDPAGEIKLHANFETDGNVGDQFKMTYDVDAAAKTGTFYGIFARQVWSSSGCQGEFFTQNTLESWDVSVPGKPQRLDELAFGKKNETVRGSAFDADRKVAYAITAQRIDPLYALSFANRSDLRVLSEIDGLSGDMSVFRLVGDKKFLLAVGQDQSSTCTGFQTGGFSPTKIAVSLIDVQNLNSIRLVQRQCVAVKNAEWIGSGVQNNLDQAHKLLGQHFDGQINVLTVPVYYTKRIDNPTNGDWWWYRSETAVGMMTWDLTRYDPSKNELQQSVIQNFGTFVHPHGEVRRSIVFTHEGATKRRMMINLSDTHLSVANLVDMSNPTMEAEIEVAPFYNQIYRFGDYLVEQVQSKPQGYGGPSQDVATFRVKKAGGSLDEAPSLASFEVGQIYRVLKHDNALVLFRQVLKSQTPGGMYVPPTTEALVVDLRNPLQPRLAGKVAVPLMNIGYYPYWCGLGAYWGSYWFAYENNFATTERGLAFYTSEYRYEGGNGPGRMLNRLVFLDLRNLDVPAVTETPLPETIEWGSFGLVSDPIAPAGFYITNRKKIGEQRGADNVLYARYKYYAQRWEPAGDKWAAVHDINTPGRLIRTWKSADDKRMFLSQDNQYRSVGSGMEKYWVNDYRLSLLREVTVQGRQAAELLDSRVLTDVYPGALLIEGDKLLINGRQQINYWYGWGDVAVGPGRAVGSGTATNGGGAPLPSWETTSDRLMIFDLSGNKLATAYDKPTRMYNMQLMGTHQGKLFINLTGNGQYYSYYGYSGGGGDGILVVDVANAGAPRGVKFLRTLGYATHLEFFGDDVYVASGFFGLTHMTLSAGAELPIEPIM
jgi:hypothetical protein